MIREFPFQIFIILLAVVGIGAAGYVIYDTIHTNDQCEQMCEDSKVILCVIDKDHRLVASCKDSSSESGVRVLVKRKE